MTQMNVESPPFFLFLGDSDREAVTSKLKAAGWEYQKKRLESRLKNWESIFFYLDKDNLAGVLTKITNTTYRVLAQPEYAEATEELFSRLQHVPHMIFIHEALFTGIDTPRTSDIEEDFYYDPNYFTHPPANVREHINKLLDQYELNVVPYRKNVELAVMAAAFVDQNERNLIFRLYVPTGRMWAAEADKLLQLFRDYLGKVSGLNVRQDQYTTNQGVVYEFFGDHAFDPTALPKEFDEFSKLLDMCVANPSDATKMLSGRSIDARSVAEIVERYAKEAKRLHVDLKHDRERAVLSIRHRMESELVEVAGTNIHWDEINELIDMSVPKISGVSSAIGFGNMSSTAIKAENLTINVRPQIISSVQGIVAQEVSGTQNFGIEAKDLLEVIKIYGGSRVTELTSAVYELEDNDAKHEDRLSARQKIKAFLYKMPGKISDVAFGILQSYIENKLGL